MKALRILVVEDDLMLGELLAEMLEDMGHDICALVTTQAGAVAAAADHCPDLMIVDARLDAGCGVMAVNEILLARFVPHVFMSGNVARVKALSPGAKVLKKPFRESELVRAIEGALDVAAPS